jgi:hypothetical protein
MEHLPVNLTRILKETQGDTMHRRIAPPLIEEATSAVQMSKVIFVRLPSPEAEIGDLEIAPEMAGTVSSRFLVVFRPPLTVDQPWHGVIWFNMLWMGRLKFHRLAP